MAPYDTLLQNATGIITNATVILLQNATEVYYKMRHVFYYKMRRLLQNATFITNCESAMRNMLQSYMFHVFTQLSIHYRYHFTYSYQLIYYFQEI